MNPVTAWILVAAVVAAVANWWSRWADHRPTELVTKPAVTTLVIAAACTIDVADGSVRAWFIGAFVCCLAGDVFLMLGSSKFLFGLASFLVGHLLFLAGLVLFGSGSMLMAVLGVAVAMTALVVAGRRIVAAAAAESPKLEAPVSGYLLAISVMTVVAWRTANPWAVAGATSFMISDAILGWNQFVANLRWAPPAIMATYHLALFGLLLSMI